MPNFVELDKKNKVSCDAGTETKDIRLERENWLVLNNKLSGGSINYKS